MREILEFGLERGRCRIARRANGVGGQAPRGTPEPPREGVEGRVRHPVVKLPAGDSLIVSALDLAPRPTGLRTTTRDREGSPEKRGKKEATTTEGEGKGEGAGHAAW